MIFCNRTDCYNWADECCECYENITIDENGCQNYVSINPEDYTESEEDE